MKLLAKPLRRAAEAAATLTGKRFGLLVASSLVATSAIVAAAMTSANGSGPLAALLGRSLAADRSPTLSSPPPAVEESGGEEVEETEPSPRPSAPVEAAPEPEPAPAPEATPANDPEGAETKPEEPDPEAGPVKHIFVVSLASSGYEAAFGAAASQMPYLSATLQPQGDLLSNYKLLSAAGLPNSIATVSGQKPTAESKAECPNYEKCVYPAETLSLADQLGLAGFTWRGYMEGMVNPETGQPDTCVYPQPGAPEETAIGGYSPRLNPFVYFHSLLDLGECAANDVPLTELEKNLKKAEKTPNYSYISPDLCNAGVVGECAAGTPEGAAAADAFLSQWVPKILASPAYKKDGLLIVTFGSVNPTPADPTTGAPAVPATDLKTGALLVSPFITPGSTDGVAYNPDSLLKSTEELFGVDAMEAAKGKKVKSFAAAVAAAAGEDGGD